MKESDETKIYSNNNRTSVYDDSEKLIKESVHHLKAGDDIDLNNKVYKIIEIISESTGEAVIYKIEDVKQNILALKLYYEFHNPENEPNTEALARIKNIEDEDILNLYDYGTGINKYKGKYCYEISDFAYGHDLLNVENFREKYNPEFIEKEVVPQIFLGILKLHQNRIYHCDLKPQNIFYLDIEQIEMVIGDYGSAKTFEFDAEKQSRKTTTVKGTDFYLPPEQARGFISQKNDFYSFGLVLLHLFYPESILININEPKSLRYSKLKQIIERQFEAKPIIDFNPKFKRINNLIEGLTLVDFNLRWGKEEIEKWIQGEEIEIVYRESMQAPGRTQISAGKVLNFGKYTINTQNDLRDYILNDENWYEDLVEDKDNWNDFINWMLSLNKGDNRKRSALNRIVKNYSQEGIEFIAEAIIRFFIPEHPVIFGLKSFNFTEVEDIREITAHAFNHFISDLWDNSSDKDIQLYLFRYEFALRMVKDKQAEVLELLNILYKQLNTKGKIRDDFYNYKVYAYTSVSKTSLTNIKQFLCEYLPNKTEIDFIKLNEQNELHFKLERTPIEYLTKIGINNLFINEIFEDTIPVFYPENYDSIDYFFKKTIYTTINNNAYDKHLGTKELFSAEPMNLLKEKFIEEYNKLFDNLKKEYKKLLKELPKEIKRQSDVKSDLNKIDFILTQKKYHKINTAFNLIKETRKYEKKQLSIHTLKVKQSKQARRKTRKEFVDEYWSIGVTTLPIIIFVLIMFGPEIGHYFMSLTNYEEILDKKLALEQIEMVKIKGGTFKMGHKNGPENETPLHTVYLDDFYLSKYEITNEQFCHFLNDYGSINVKEGEYRGQKMIYYSGEEERDWGINNSEDGYRPSVGYKNYPVVYVTWFGANEYCKWVGGRLPSEAEWEYSARGGNKTKGYKYSGSNKIKDVSWYNSNSDIQTHKVGKKSPNELGIYDMSGNVYEWCGDWYDKNYYRKTPKNNPVNLTKSKFKVLRGGSYYDKYSSSMPCYRIAYEPISYYSNFGFRLCRDNNFRLN